ncbi:VOC family protein [Amycolatopsis dendrobii]|uniref:VOC family protein n=1 Tax=Amycolatopsis dendrobii TaxID=2760662 RepID=A0A7W3VRY4_9PSEU|nr:VOC family protein [Amycolatopsis dendrobii]MBB1151969.1 VOC family protein [Amycolatopsis dendrobii]
MADAPPPQTVYPNLTYEDPKAALEFLVEAFGFESHFVVDGENGVEHAQVRAGASLIFLTRDHDADQYGMHSPLALGGTSHALCVWVPDSALDGHQARAEAAGGRILNPVHDSPAGVREYSCADPEGQVWTFSSYAGE